MASKQEQLELDFLKVKVRIVRDITDCSTFEQLDEYIHNVNKIFDITSFLDKNKASHKEIGNVEILEE